MHYKDGTEAKLFDVVKFRAHQEGAELTGVLVNTTPGATSCNGVVQYLAPRSCFFYSENPPKLTHLYSAMITDHITIGEAELVYRDPAVV